MGVKGEREGDAPNISKQHPRPRLQRRDARDVHEPVEHRVRAPRAVAQERQQPHRRGHEHARQRHHVRRLRGGQHLLPCEVCVAQDWGVPAHLRYVVCRMLYVSVGRDERTRRGEIGEGEGKGGRRTDVAVPVLILTRVPVPVTVAVTLARVHGARARVPKKVREERGRVPAAREEEQEPAADVDVRRRGGPRGQQDRCVYHVRQLRGEREGSAVSESSMMGVGGGGGGEGKRMRMRERTYDSPAGALERDDEGGGAARLVALVPKPEIGVVLGDQEARDQDPADVEERSSRTCSPR